MNLEYFELLSPEPIKIYGIGSVISPTLRNISKLGINIYRNYLNILVMTPKEYFSLLKLDEEFKKMSSDEKENFNIFDLLTIRTDTAKLLEDVLNFFIEENIQWNQEENCFFSVKTIVEKDTTEKNVNPIEKDFVVGRITKENYSKVCDIICQRNYVKTNVNEDLSKIKNKKALEIMKKIQKGRNEKAKITKADKNMELGNIVSALANKSQSINIINIWDATIFQIWDSFAREIENIHYGIQTMGVAVWGDKENRFDLNAWFKNINL